METAFRYRVYSPRVAGLFYNYRTSKLKIRKCSLEVDEDSCNVEMDSGILASP